MHPNMPSSVIYCQLLWGKLALMLKKGGANENKKREVAGWIFEIEQNGCHILVPREILPICRWKNKKLWNISLPYWEWLKFQLFCLGGGDEAPFFTKPAFLHPNLCKISRRTRIWHPFCSISNIQPATGHFEFLWNFSHLLIFSAFLAFKISKNQF